MAWKGDVQSSVVDELVSKCAAQTPALGDYQARHPLSAIPPASGLQTSAEVYLPCPQDPGELAPPPPRPSTASKCISHGMVLPSDWSCDGHVTKFFLQTSEDLSV